MATSLLKRGENAIAIFTHGKYLIKNQDGSGSTGNWVIDQNRKCSKVVIYNRTLHGNQVYVAKRTAVTPSKKAGRSVIELADIQYFGTTYFNWPQFSGSRNPIRYLQIPNQTRGRRRASARAPGINLELAPLVE